ncbi:MAG: HAD family hydrolase [Chthoniobacterales bacterium]|nr:MAG: HAD family hydrolase [Chthoniobacterales bacterium]
MTEKTPAVFFDRDGTIMQDVNYCSDPKSVHVFAGVCDSLRKLKASGFKLIMITNQSGIGRGYFTREQYDAVHAEVVRQVGDGLIDATYFCPDPPGIESNCRKPAPGMIVQGALEHEVDLRHSIFVGDKEIDVHCGHNAGIKTIRVRTGFETNTADSSADWVADDFVEATEIILANLAAPHHPARSGAKSSGPAA